LASFLSVFAIILALTVCGCTGSASVNPVLAVTVSPTSASLALGATQQFSGTVTGSSNTAVTWSVNGVPGGNPTDGTISNSGLYAAPAVISPGSVSVTAASQADSTKQASASVAVRQQVLAVAAAPAQGMTPAAALDLVLAAGGRGQGVDLHWPAMEPSPGVYDFTTANKIITDENQGPFQIHVALDVINTTVREVPADLATTAFNDPLQMLPRFTNMLTALLNQYGTKIDSIAIGNEVDVYLAAHPTEWSAYATFYGQASALIRSKFPSVRVGVTSTFGGATGATNSPLIAGLNSVSDMFMMNYYPLNANYTPLDPSVVSADFVKILVASQGKPILLQEVGYPTSTQLGSSEQMQAQFVINVFSEWMKAGDKIEYLSFFLLHDDTPANCQLIAAQFGVTDPNFPLFFCSLGLRNSDGTDKLGWPALKTAAQADGFTAQ
jgi:hypothetical protein